MYEESLNECFAGGNLEIKARFKPQLFRIWLVVFIILQ